MGPRYDVFRRREWIALRLLISSSSLSGQAALNARFVLLIPLS